MDSEALFRFGFFAISMTVFATVLAGGFLWSRWFYVGRFFPDRKVSNFSDYLSRDLMTRESQQKPCWTVLEFALAFGLMLVISATLARRAMNALPKPSEVATVDSIGDSVTADSTPQTVTQQPVTPQASSETDATTETNTKPSMSDIPLRSQVAIHFAATALTLFLTLLYLKLARGATLAKLGMIPSIEDLRKGIVATAWILAPVLLVNLVVSQLVKYEHSVTNMLAQDNNIPTFVFLFLSAAVLTPIAEEFQFRLLLQGGLQRIADGADQDDSPEWTPRSGWPILVTSLVFAMLHLGQGAAPIPLFFLSIGLGYLYQSTGRLTPAIIVHMLLNGATLCMEYCKLNGGIGG